MEKKVEFNKVGKDMPYSIPEGFFEEMEKNVREEIGKQPEIGLDA